MGIARMVIGSVGGTSWDISLFRYNPVAVWDISAAVFSKQASVALQETSPQGLFFKPDGTKMYVLGETGQDINEYNLNTAWDLFTASYLQNFSVAAQEATPQELFFKPDGTKMYVVGVTGQDVNEYNLSTAWDISTAVYLQNFSVAAQDTFPVSVSFKPDGTKMYVTGLSGRDINEYNLSTAWDVSTAVYSQNFSVSAQDTAPYSLFFKPDGTKMYVLGNAEDDVNEYNLSTPWDVSTSVYSQNFSVAEKETNPRGLFFKPDGTKMYVLGETGQDINEYNLGGFDISAQLLIPLGIFFRPDGLKMYIVDQSGDDVNEYNLSTAWNITTAVYSQNFSIAAQDTLPQDVFFKPDGLKMYLTGASGDDINEYNLSTAWDISTAVYSQNFSLAAQETTPTGIFFKPDGLKMYIGGSAGNDVNEYNLSTAWDISTAVYLQNFSVAAQTGSPLGIFFKPDGLKMYIAEASFRRIYEWDLVTAWDISTAVYSQNFKAVADQDGIPAGLFFRPDGRYVYVVGSSTKSIYQYFLG